MEDFAVPQTVLRRCFKSFISTSSTVSVSLKIWDFPLVNILTAMIINFLGATVVFVIRGDNINLHAIDTKVLQGLNPIIYFPEARTVSVHAIALWGGFFAPHAEVTAYNGQGNGWFFVKSIAAPPGGQPTMQMNVKPFTFHCPGITFIFNSCLK